MNALPYTYASSPRVSDAHRIDPADNGPEPDESHYDTAFDQLMADGERFADFLAEQDTRTLVAVFQMFHADGLPAMDKSLRSDRLSDAYDAAFGGVIAAYRADLERSGKLREQAYAVMDAEAEEARRDAAEAATGY